MEVILIEPIRKLGNVGDVVKVKNGFARNYLIPANKALRSTKDNVAYFEAKKSEIEAANKKNKSAAETASKKIEGIFVALTRQAGEDGRLYGSVTSIDIARELAASKADELDRKQITLNTPIKYIGIYEIEVHLHAEVIATINVNVARTATEAKEAEARFKKGEEVMEGPSASTSNNNQPEEEVDEAPEATAKAGDDAEKAAEVKAEDTPEAVEEKAETADK